MNYKVYQGDELKQTVTDKIAVMNGLQPNQSYVFGVQPDNGQKGSVGANLIAQSDLKYGFLNPSTGGVTGSTNDFHSENYIATNGATVFTFSSPDYAFKGSGGYDRIAMYDSDKNYLGCQPLTSATQTLGKSNAAYIRFSIVSTEEGSTTGNASDWLANHRYKLEKGSVATTYVATTSVTTRGIRFNIPKTLTVGSNITLRYEEYPLGIVPIGNEPSGYFGGGNKQNLSATVISTANGGSIVEVAGNVIDVGGKNLIPGKSNAQDQFHAITGTSTRDANYDVTHFWNLPLEKDTDYTASFWVKTSENTDIWSYLYDSGSDGSYTDGATTNQATTDYTRVVVHFHNGNNTATPNFIPVRIIKKDVTAWFYGIKLEQGTIATPYAAFVDGDTFTAQPDGTCALFSEHKALYY